MRITKELIKELLESNKIQLVDDEHCGDCMCQIGEYRFYFGWWAEAAPVKEIIRKYGMDEIIKSINDVLKSKEDAEDNGIYEDEYNYYIACIEEMMEGK